MLDNITRLRIPHFGARPEDRLFVKDDLKGLSPPEIPKLEASGHDYDRKRPEVQLIYRAVHTDRPRCRVSVKVDYEVGRHSGIAIVPHARVLCHTKGLEFDAQGNETKFDFAK